MSVPSPFSARFTPKKRPAISICFIRPAASVGGDELTISATIDPDCHALITMPGASKFYRSSGAQARLQQTLTLAENSTLEWLPQDAIFFPGANAFVAYRISSRRLQHAAGLGPAESWPAGHRRSL